MQRRSGYWSSLSLFDHFLWSSSFKPSKQDGLNFEKFFSSDSIPSLTVWSRSRIRIFMKSPCWVGSKANEVPYSFSECLDASACGFSHGVMKTIRSGTAAGVQRGGLPLSPELMKYTLVPCDWKKYLYHRGSQWCFSVYSGEWNNSRRKRGGQSSSSCLSDSIE